MKKHGGFGGGMICTEDETCPACAELKWDEEHTWFAPLLTVLIFVVPLVIIYWVCR